MKDYGKEIADRNAEQEVQKRYVCVPNVTAAGDGV